MESKLIKMNDELPMELGERLPRKGEFAAWDARVKAEVEEGQKRAVFEKVDHTFNHTASMYQVGWDYAQETKQAQAIRKHFGRQMTIDDLTCADLEAVLKGEDPYNW